MLLLTPLLSSFPHSSVEDTPAPRVAVVGDLSPHVGARGQCMTGRFGLGCSLWSSMCFVDPGLRCVVRKIKVELDPVGQHGQMITIWNDKCFLKNKQHQHSCSATFNWLCFFLQYHLCSDSQIRHQKTEGTEGPVEATSYSPCETSFFLHCQDLSFY